MSTTEPNKEPNKELNNTEKTLLLFDAFIDKFLIQKISLSSEGLFTDEKKDIKSVEKFNTITLKDVTKFNNTQTNNKKKGKETDNKEIPNSGTSLEEILQNEKNKKFCTILWHAYWIMYLMGKNTNKFHGDFRPGREIQIEEGKISLFIDEPIASTQQLYTKDPIAPFRTLLSLFCHIWDELKDNKIDKEAVKVKERIIEILQNDKIDDIDIDKRIKNLLLYLCAPQKHLPILSENHKTRIYTNLKFITDNNTAKAECDESDDKTADGENKNNETVDSSTEVSSAASSSDIDSTLCNIEKKLKELLSKNPDSEYNTCDAIYDSRIKPLWQKEPKTGELPSDILLKYKKAMVLYGPPGTGKTYTAANLAKMILFKHMFKEWKKAKDNIAGEKLEEITKILNLKEEALDEYPNISYLQFHINYTYEYFIAGQTIESDNKSTQLKTKCGFIYDIINKANDAINTAISQKTEVSIIEANNKIEVVITEGNCKESQDSNNKEQTNEEKTRIENIKKHITKNKELQKAINAAPFIVILDEMNRVDVSRVFGELFTAIEKRGTDVLLTLPDPKDEKKRLKLNIPYNIYFIGTMNEIDFSLEQIDFALRRRFIWELADYSENALKEIIKERIENTGKIEEDIENFLKNCTALNKKIADKLGEEYHIGHAFFAEIANIYNELIENSSSGKTFKQAQNILWQISIGPTIEAYCGTMEKNAKNAFINDCKNVFQQ